MDNFAERSGYVMDYDHHKKAGNQGDIVKHIALTAAIQGILPSFHDDTFRYADTFAGYALNPLVNMRGHEWKQGVGALVRNRGRFIEDSAIEHWATKYLNENELAGAHYPGSSVLVRELLRSHSCKYHLSLWDIADDPVKSLRDEFGDEATVYQRPAKAEESDIQQATFLFIDPPGLKTKSKREYPPWKEIKSFLPQQSSKQRFMMWLPIKAVTVRKNVPLKPPGEDSLSDVVRAEMTKLGFSVIKVRYLPGGRTIGCQIVHNFSGDVAAQIDQAVSKVVDIAGWQAGLPPETPAFSTF